MANLYGPKIVTSGLVLLLDAGNSKSYPGSGTTWTDITRLGSNGTLTNGPVFSTNNRGIFVLGGTNEYILFTNATMNSIFQTAAFSVELWIKTSNTTNYKGIFCLGYQFDMYYYSNSFFVICTTPLGGINTGNSGIVINDDRWHQIGFYGDSSGFSWSLDGVIRHSVVSAIWNGTINNTGGFSGIGRPANVGGYFPGSIACFRFYQKKLVASEILQNYNATKGRFGL